MFCWEEKGPDLQYLRNKALKVCVAMKAYLICTNWKHTWEKVIITNKCKPDNKQPLKSVMLAAAAGTEDCLLARHWGPLSGAIALACISSIIFCPTVRTENLTDSWSVDGQGEDGISFRNFHKHQQRSKQRPSCSDLCQQPQKWWFIVPVCFFHGGYNK